MKHGLSRAGASASLLVAALAGFSGCADEDTGLFIIGNVLTEPPDCLARPEANTSILLRGRLDVAFSSSYEALLLVGNQLTPRSNKEGLRTETAVTTMTGAEVQLFTDTGELDTEFTVPASGVISPDTAEDPGFGIVLATLIPQATGRALETELSAPGAGGYRTRVARVKVFGETIGGVEVESSVFTYVINVCWGCSVVFPQEALDQDGNCTLPTEQEIEGFCGGPGVDSNVDCRTCNRVYDFCVTPR